MAIKRAAPATRRSLRKIFIDGFLSDIAINADGKELLLLGPAGPRREYSFLPSKVAEFCELPGGGGGGGDAFNPALHLPVLMGGGMGHALRALVKYLEHAVGPDFALAVADIEQDLLEASGLPETTACRNILWVNERNPAAALSILSKWQMRNGHKPFYCIANPAYLRLDRAYYSTLREQLEASTRANFWEKAAYPKFKEKKTRILLITSGYFLIGDVQAACARMDVEYRLINLPDKTLELNLFIEQLLTEVVNFRPDFALTINHLGVDREGVLQDLLARVRLPLASWFVDNPHLILYRYVNVVSPWTYIFTWDADNLHSLRDLGFEHVQYLPLGTDHMRFTPLAPETRAQFSPCGWESRVSFVGNSMLHKVAGRMKTADPPPALRQSYKEIALAFAGSDERSVKGFLERNYPSLMPDFDALSSIERQLSYETLITWEATLRYRLSCVQATLPFNPLILGDDGWLELLLQNTSWRYHKELSYYDELPYFYPFSEVNFNCTSKQMKGAVNQRVFDVPACRSFIITDWREQIERLFEPGKEVICYNSPEEAKELIARYLNHPAEREKIAVAGRRRVLAEHCYEHRMQKLIEAMRKTYA